MSQVIAGIYEIQEQIGAGGGGIVYLGRHMRLDKQVVLKADKRTLKTRMETLRREVDMLKGLSHTYIPQVYDFVQEDGVVYTVMDYIEGESLDKLLGRKQLPSQPQVIRWADQLLDALSYLHHCEPHGILHGDIKPANIMLRPSGDICLIDFNIALALGENGAVKAGFSRGYASPEHYSTADVGIEKTTDAGNGSRRADILPERDRSEKSGNADQTVVDGCDTDQTEVDGYDTDQTEVDGRDTDKTEVVGYDTDKTEVIDYDRDGGISAVRKPDIVPQRSTENHPVMMGSATGEKAVVMLDVRSDIYSLGATLYHMISGKRPAEKASEVIPLGEDICSPTVSAILMKAMAPDPDMRYQTADEMRTAFLQLRGKDPRVLRRKRHMVVSAVLTGTLLVLGGASSFIGLKQLEQRQAALTMAEYSANALAEGDVVSAVRQAMQAIPTGKNLLEAPVTPQARKALTDALGIYDLSDGFKSLGTVALPAAPFDLAVSSDGSRFAVVYAYEVAVFETETMRKITALPARESALSDVVFADEETIVYAGEQGVTAYDLSAEKVLWTGDAATFLTISEDGSVAAAVDRDEERVVLYRVLDGTRIAERSFEGKHMAVAANDIFADPQDYIFTLKEDGSMLAVSFENGGLVIFDIAHPEDDLIIYEESDYRHFEGGFFENYFAYTAGKTGDARFGLVDTAQGIYLGGYQSQDPFLLKADRQGICLASNNLLVRFDPDTMEETELAYTGNTEITEFSVGNGYVMTATKDHCLSFYDSGANLSSTESGSENFDFVMLAGAYAIAGNRNEPSLRLMKLEDHNAMQLISYDARYAHDEARISGDGRTIMLFGYEGFRIYDRDGNVAEQKELPDSGNIYDQQFVRDGEDSWLEVIWYDGTLRRYSAADGTMISEETVEPPGKDLYEEFLVDGYRIESPLHGAPKVYEQNSGKLVATLEEDSYLTYVTSVETQDERYIITEYISAAGERYGLLLDQSFQTIACLPGLCDVVGDMLVFDYSSGNLRQCSIYSLQELVTLGEAYLEAE